MQKRLEQSRLSAIFAQFKEPEEIADKSEGAQQRKGETI